MLLSHLCVFKQEAIHAASCDITAVSPQIGPEALTAVYLVIDGVFGLLSTLTRVYRGLDDSQQLMPADSASSVT